MGMSLEGIRLLFQDRILDLAALLVSISMEFHARMPIVMELILPVMFSQGSTKQTHQYFRFMLEGKRQSSSKGLPTS